MSENKKTVIIDARVVVKNHCHGIAHHTRELILNLIELDTQEIKFILLVNKQSPFFEIKFPSNFQLYIMSSNWINFLGQWELYCVIKKLKPDLYHSPSFIIPLFCHVPLVCTIHDLNHVALSENYSYFHKVYYKYFFDNRIQNSACAVITVSEFSKSEIISYLKIKSEKIKVIYNGILDCFKNKDFFSQSELEFIKDKYELPSKFLLSIGNKKPHKNLARLVEGYCQSDLGLPLVLLTDFDEKLTVIADKYGKKHLLYFLRFVDDGDFPKLYCLAEIFIYPSYYEGFGLPPLEAAVCGIPVVVGSKTALPEIMENVPIYVDPYDIEDLKRGINLALNMQAHEKEELKMKGIELSKKYSWQKMAMKTLNVYKEALSQNQAIK